MEKSKFSEPKFLIVIAGPTCSGKSALALKLAIHYKCAIISSDSRQIYREMNIGTAKPTFDDRNLVPHYFVDHKSVHDTYNAGQFGFEVNHFLESYYASHNIAVMCGGTGLYIKSVLEELDDLPAGDIAYAEYLDQIYKTNGIEYLQQLLKNTDPDYYNDVDLNNPHRIIRALVASKAAGAPYSSLLHKKVKKKPFYHTLGILIHPPRQDLYNQINLRVDQMMELGLEDEVKSLIPFKNLRALQTVGYSELFSYFASEISLQEAVEEIKKNTRRYAKRQLTWFKKQGEWQEFLNADKNAVLTYIEQKILEFPDKS